MYPFLLVVTFGLEFLHDINDIYKIPTNDIRCFFVGLIMLGGHPGPQKLKTTIFSL